MPFRKRIVERARLAAEEVSETVFDSVRRLTFRCGDSYKCCLGLQSGLSYLLILTLYNNNFPVQNTTYRAGADGHHRAGPHFACYRGPQDQSRDAAQECTLRRSPTALQ